MQIHPKILGLQRSAWIEIGIFFLSMWLLALFFHLKINYWDISPHPFWIVVLLVSAQYGVNEGLAATIISTVFLLIGPLPSRNILQDRYDYFFILIKNPVLWFVFAVLLGEICSRHIRKKEHFERIAFEAEKKEQQLAESYEALKHIKEHLELHIAAETQTILKKISAFNELSSLSSEKILQGAADLIKILMAPEKFSLYFLKGQTLCFAFQQGWDDGDFYRKEFSSDTALFHEVIVLKNTVSLLRGGSDVLQDQGIVAAPIHCSKSSQALGMIKIEQIPFLRLRSEEIEILCALGEWIGGIYFRFLQEKGTS